MLLLANTGDDEKQSLQEVSPIGAPALPADAEPWVQVAGAGLAITEDERKWWAMSSSSIRWKQVSREPMWMMRTHIRLQGSGCTHA